MLRDGMPCEPIQGQGQGHTGPKVTKMADFTSMHANVNYDTTRQCLNFNWTDLDMRPHSVSLGLKI